jgi:hypothetical protein
VGTLMTPYEFELERRLEGIFNPIARKQRDALYGDTPYSSARFVHYTSAASALNIIRSKRLWMRNTTCMTDYREVSHGYDILFRFFSQEKNRSSFVQSLEACAPGCAEEALQLFNQWLPDIRLNTYITSVSEHDAKEDIHGRLSMWRAFGAGNIPRVAFVIKVPALSGARDALNVMFSPVAYLNEEEVHGVIGSVIQNIGNGASLLAGIDPRSVVRHVFYMLVAGVACLKHEGFREEREWRVIYSPHRLHSDLIDSSIETIGGVPQVVYRLPLDATRSNALADVDFFRMFDRLIIGPSSYPWVMYHAFVKELSEAGVTNAHHRVVSSGIPIRS